jgi:predicted nucleic acid-binding protein
MGLVEQLIGSRVCIDTAPLIYFVEKHPIYLRVVKPVFSEIELGHIEAFTSTITLLEVLVHPFRTNNQELAEKYREILLASEHFTTFEILHQIAENASRLRAKYSLKTPDAIQIAGGVFYGADKFLTNDADLKKIQEIQVLVIDDFVVDLQMLLRNKPHS